MRQNETTGARALGAEAWEGLRVAALIERGDRQQLRCGDDALAAAAVDAHLEHRLSIGEAAEPKTLRWHEQHRAVPFMHDSPADTPDHTQTLKPATVITMREAPTALAVSTIMLRALPFSSRTSLAPPTTSCNLLACSSTRRRRVLDSKPSACSRTMLAPRPRARPAANSTSASESGRPSLATRMRRANSPGDVERATSRGVVNELSAVTATPF